MTDFSVRSDNVDVEQIMRQIRARIREKRGVDYTEDEIRELANVKLEKFLDPKGVRSDLLQQYREVRESSATVAIPAFEDTPIYSSARPLVRFFRRLLNPLLKLFFNPRPVIESIQAQTRLSESEKLTFELIHNLVVELTRTTIEVRNLKMRLESMASRLDFDERRARALEGVVQYRPGVVPPLQPPAAAAAAAASNDLDNDGNERRQRRRRRRGRRRPPFGREGAETGTGGDPSAAGDESRLHAAEPSFHDSREPAHQTSGDADSHDDGGDGHSSES
jgi:hypothetical protein